MASVIDVKPKTLDLSLYAGDGFRMRVECKTPAGAPVDITGAVAAEIRVTKLAPDPPIVEFAANMVDAYLGIFVLTLTGAQTQDLLDHESASNGKFVGVWDLQWTPAGDEPRTLCQGKVECEADVTR